MKKKILLSSLLAATLFLTACNQEQTGTESSTSSQEVTSSSVDSESSASVQFSSSTATGDSYVSYSDGSKIVLDGEDFFVSLNDGTTITFIEDEYTIHTADGTAATKSADGSYSIVLESGLTIYYDGEEKYLVRKNNEELRTGSGQEELNQYLEENDFPTIATFDKQVEEMRQYINDHQ